MNEVNSSVTRQYFVDMAVSALEISIAIRKKQFEYGGYNSGKLLSEIVQRAAGIGRMPFILNKKARDNYLWMKNWLDGHKAYCLADPPVPVDEKLLRFATTCLRSANEPTNDWSHFRSNKENAEKFLRKNS